MVSRCSTITIGLDFQDGEAVMFEGKKAFPIIIFGLVSKFFLAAAPSFAQVPQVQHVVIVVEENTNYADVCGPNNVSMPFLCSLEPGQLLGQLLRANPPLHRQL